MVLLRQKNVLKRAKKGLDPCQNGVRLHRGCFALPALFFGAPPGSKIWLDG